MSDEVILLHNLIDQQRDQMVQPVSLFAGLAAGPERGKGRHQRLLRALQG